MNHGAHINRICTGHDAGIRYVLGLYLLGIRGPFTSSQVRACAVGEDSHGHVATPSYSTPYSLFVQYILNRAGYERCPI